MGTRVGASEVDGARIDEADPQVHLLREDLHVRVPLLHARGTQRMRDLLQRKLLEGISELGDVPCETPGDDAD